MARLNPVDPRTSTELEAVYDEIARSRGWVSNAMKSLANAPEGLRRFAHFGDYVRYHTDLTERVRELVIVTIGRAVQYAATHHGGLAIQAGIPKEAVDDILANRVPASLPGDEQSVVRYVMEFSAGASITDATFAELHRHFSDRAVTDITLLAAYYLAYGSMIKTLQVQLENSEKLDVEMRWQKAKTKARA